MLKTLEAVLAILLIATVFIVFYQTLGPLPDFETIGWKIIGYNNLKTLDRNLGLRQEVQTGNTSAIIAKIANYMPATVNYIVSICSVSCTAPLINASRVISVSYIIAGYRDNYNPNQVILYMWSKS